MTSWLRTAWPFGWTRIAFASVALSSFLLATHELGAWPWIDRRPLRERYHFKEVVRTDLIPVMSAPGRLDSSRMTTIRCELENIAGVSTGASTILSLTAEGTYVKRGDVLATLDGSNYEEMLRQQTITVEQAKASHLQAQLNHEIALLAVKEYRDGVVEEKLKGMEGNIALARSDLSRAQDHLTWTRRMNEKGYATAAQIATETQGVAKLKLSVQALLTELELYKRFTLLKTEKSLRGDVTSAATSLTNETLRLQRQLDRYEQLKKQVARCTIRAPHDGLLLYHKERRRSSASIIAEGMDVRQKQELFDLPDLSEMEVQVVLNESVVVRVAPGQRVLVSFEALPKMVRKGRLESIGQIPFRLTASGGGGQAIDTGVRYFLGIVKLDAVADELRPGMTAMVDFSLSRCENVLAIPHQAVKSDRGQKICFVAHDERLERRPVKIGQDTTDMVEVLDGLHEGEMVALNPPGTMTHVVQLTGFNRPDPRRDPTPESVASSQH